MANGVARKGEILCGSIDATAEIHPRRELIETLKIGNRLPDSDCADEVLKVKHAALAEEQEIGRIWARPRKVVSRE